VGEELREKESETMRKGKKQTTTVCEVMTQGDLITRGANVQGMGEKRRARTKQGQMGKKKGKT